MQAFIEPSLAEDGAKLPVAQSAASIIENYEEVQEFGEEIDDFMDTYLAINLELKVKESDNNSRIVKRSNVKSTSPMPS